MIRKLLLTAALLFGMGAFLSAQAQPQINSFNNDGDSCYVNTLNAQGVSMWGTIGNPTAGVTVTIFWGDGSSSPANVSATGGNFWAGHAYTLAGTYSVMAVLFDAANNAVDSNQISVEAYCYVLYGNRYKRNDANCTYDLPIDNPLYAFQEIEVRKNNVPIDTFSAMGFFSYRIISPDLTSEFSLHPLTSPTGYNQVCPAASAVYKVRLDTLNYNDHFDYGFECNSSTNFDLFVYMSGFLRFVNNSYLHINAGNSACVPKNGVVTLNIDPQYVYSAATPAPTSVSGQTVTWNLSNLSGSTPAYIGVTLTPAGVLTPGDSSCHQVSITPSTGDTYVPNNTFNFCDSIRASMDPNDKKVSPMGNIAAGTELTYTLNFENLGNDTAFNVHIIDTLSTNLDPASFSLVTSSHQVRPNLFNYGSTKIVRFDFANIKLADKNHPESNKGFIIYKAKAKAGLAPGTEISNTGHIYFDINPAVVTNTVRNKIPNPNSIGKVGKEDGITIYPNPTDDVLFLDSKTDRFNKAMVVNTLGQIISEYQIGKGSNRIETTGLSSGIYYLIVNGKEGSKAMKITKK